MTQTLFEWDGFGWRDLTPAFSPSGRDEAALVYMPWNDRSLLFGGYRFGRVLAETWEWDGGFWRDRSGSAGVPPARKAHAMAEDPLRGEVLLFGGEGSGRNPLADTWTWSDGGWTLRRPQHVPPARTRHAMVWDPARRRVVLHGGVGAAGSLADTWEWDGRDWIQRQSAHAPPAFGTGLAMTYDLRRNRVIAVLSPGFEIWEWNGIDWARRAAPGRLPPERFGVAVSYDLDSDRLLLYGGRLSNTQWIEDCWAWDPGGNRWSPIETTPLAANRPKLVSLGRGGPLLLHLDDIDQWPGRSPQTWTFDGYRWNRLRTATDPSAGLDMALEVDPRDGTVWKLAQTARETWRFDGTDWTLFPTATQPADRYYVGSAFDTTRGEWVTFGGSRPHAGFSVLDETWIFDGSDWARRGVSGPSARQAPGMVYDPQRRVVVLFGGRMPGRFLDDTWEWDGARWIRRFSATTPEHSPDPELLYDADRNVVRLLTGSDASAGRYWEWDGVDWSVHRTDSFGYWHGPGMQFAWDPARRGTVAFGLPRPVNLHQRHAWLLSAAPAVVGPFGSACPGPDGALRLETTWRPSRGFGLRLDIVGAPPLAATVIGLSLNRVDVPFGRCTLYYDPSTRILEEIYLADVHGSVRLPLRVPADPALSGVTLHGQAAALADVPGGLVTSRGLRMVFGD